MNPGQPSDVASCTGWETTLVMTGQHLTVHRSSADPELRAQLLHTAGILGAVTHPGVETLEALDHDGGHTTMITGFAGGRSLATGAPRSVGRLAAVAAGICWILTDLHTAGIAHGPFSPGQIVLGADEEPTLCGFDRGHVYVGDDPESWDLHRSTDLRSLGAVLDRLLIGCTGHHRLRVVDAGDRWRLARLIGAISDGTECDAARAAEGFERLAVGLRWRRRRGASRAPCIEPESRRPSPAAPATDVRDHLLVSSPKDPATDPRLTRQPIERRAALMSAVLSMVIAVSVGSGVGVHQWARRTSPAAHSTPHITRPAPLTGPVIGRLSNGATLLARSTRLGSQPGDLVFIGDWNGDATMTPAIVALSRGSVCFYEDWPTTIDTIVTLSCSNVDEATGARVLRNGTGADRIVVHRAAGPPVTFDAASSTPHR